MVKMANYVLYVFSITLKTNIPPHEDIAELKRQCRYSI